MFQRGYPRAGDDIPEHFNQVTVRVILHGWDVGHVWGHRRHGPTAVRDFEKGRVRGGRFAVFAFGEEFLDVPEGVGDGDVDLGADRLGGFVDRGVAFLRVRLGVELVAQPVASPRLERCGDDAFRIAVQHEERRSFGPEGRVEVLEGLEQEPKAVGAHALGLDEPRVEHEHGLDRGGAVARLHQRRVVVDAQAFSEPQD